MVGCFLVSYRLARQILLHFCIVSSFLLSNKIILFLNEASYAWCLGRSFLAAIAYVLLNATVNYRWAVQLASCRVFCFVKVNTTFSVWGKWITNIRELAWYSMYVLYCSWLCSVLCWNGKEWKNPPLNTSTGTCSVLFLIIMSSLQYLSICQLVFLSLQFPMKGFS